MSEIRTVATDKAPAAVGPYTQGKIVNGMLYASGSIGIDPATGKKAGDTIEEQTEQICKNIAAVLEAAGSSFDKVVKTTCFITDIADFKTFNGIYAKYFTEKPARSCVAVKELPLGMLAEIEVIAVCE